MKFVGFSILLQGTEPLIDDVRGRSSFPCWAMKAKLLLAPDEDRAKQVEKAQRQARKIPEVKEEQPVLKGSSSCLGSLYYEPITDLDGTDSDSLIKVDRFLMEFSPKLKSVKLEPEILPPLLRRVREICDLPECPAGRPGCRDCSMLENLVRGAGQNLLLSVQQFGSSRLIRPIPKRFLIYPRRYLPTATHYWPSAFGYE